MDTFDLNTFLYTAVSFLIFMVLMKNVFFDPIRDIKAERDEALTGQAREAQDLLKEHQSLFASYEEQLRQARLQAQKLITEQRDKAKSDAFSQVTQTRDQARQDLESQLAAIAEEREVVYRELAPEKTALVQLILDKVVNTSASNNKGLSSAASSGSND